MSEPEYPIEDEQRAASEPVEDHPDDLPKLTAEEWAYIAAVAGGSN